MYSSNRWQYYGSVPATVKATQRSLDRPALLNTSDSIKAVDARKPRELAARHRQEKQPG
jgi:hypothetical protein